MPYITLPEMAVIYPFLVPLTTKAEQFSFMSVSDVKERVAKRFKESESGMNSQKIDDEFFLKILYEKRID